MDNVIYGGFHEYDYGDKALMSPENMMIPDAAEYTYSNNLVSSYGYYPLLGSENIGGNEFLSSRTTSITPEIQDNYGEIKAKIVSHPLFVKLLDAYVDCHKVGAPPEISSLLDEIRRESYSCKQSAAATACFEADPELDVFMKTYCDILMKFKSDLSKPFHEATTFLNNIEEQLGNLCKDDNVLSSDEEYSGKETEMEDVKMKNEKELKDNLLRKYGGHISNLKLEFSKKKKKGKLPKDARQSLLQWWNVHYKWPYPTEADKILLAELTGLDQKQINNWFINQRKRHWRPSENMQLAVMGNLSGNFFSDD